MPSERVQRQIDRLLDDAEGALASKAWPAVAEAARAVLAIDEGNEDAAAYLKMAEANLGATGVAPALPTVEATPPSRTPSGPETFANGRYEVVKFLGEGGRKKVYLAHDTLLDRQVAFALIKTEGLDEAARERITREAQTMGRLGNHPNLVSVLDIGEHTDASGVTFPWMAIELLPGGDVEGLLKKAGGPLPVEQTLKLAIEVCRGLEFLQSKGVVHRDLKPGNVWLSADGTAKIGDYGLAMSVDRTRLTLQGTMVGTVDYMPPEQALGGEMTPRSDLYSLGAMLYELVTGAPPFKGDRLTEVISQHINVAPEPPSTRGALIPRALEELILRLFAKDPADRPASAAEVRAILETVDPDDVPLLPDPALRAAGVFVGRSRELAELRRRYDEAAGGTSRIVLLVGQPGIGKTRLARELEGYARSRGARVLWSRSPEAGGAPPYWLLNQLLRRFLEVTDEATARQLLGEDAPRLARICPEIRERIPGVAPSPEDDSDFLTFEAMGAFLRRVASQSPLVLLLDDLHWADRASLEWLQQLARELAQAPLLVLGTYRDTELSRTHPLAIALATLNREPNFVRIAIRGLDRDQVADYLERTSGLLPSRELVDTFMRETDGNPFFLSEIVTTMLEAGTLTDATIELDIPDGVREANARRVNLLSEDAVELLKLAAVCGYEFEFTDMASLTELGDERQLELLEEALREHVIAEAGTPGRYRFVYQPMQRLLLDELSSARRIRLHGQIGERLESAYGPRAEEHAAMLARHFSESAALNPAHREKALRYGWLAGQRAEANEEIGAAVQWFGRSLELVRADVILPGVDEADALAAWGRTEVRRTGSAAAFAAIDRAVELFAGTGRAAAAARAALGLWGVSLNLSGDRTSTLDRAIDALDRSEPALMASLLALRSERVYSHDADADADVARGIASEHGLQEVEGRLLLRDARRLLQVGAHSEAIAIATRVVEQFRSNEPRLVAGAQLELSLILINAGMLGEAERPLREVLRDRSAHNTFPQTSATGRLAALLLLHADPELDSLVDRAAPGNLVDRVLMRRYEMRGDLSRAIRGAERGVEIGDGNLLAGAALARLRYETGDMSGANEILASLRGGLNSPDLQLCVRIANALDVALSGVMDPASLGEIADRRWETADGVPFVVANIDGSFDRARAMWALALDRLDEAERLVRRGLEWCVRERCPVEEGRCHQLLADVLRRKGDDLEAARHLDAATALFQRHGARLYLDQALEQRALLKA